ncbi:heme/hemin ABC transporter substrate-binding protein [Luteolibacter flavescens]|nr:ABC transporter substrate-binding protein [Luteolibacter flavescens]
MRKTTAVIFLLLTLGRLAATPIKGADGVEVEIGDPQRIVALNASTVEILVEFGMGDRIVATDNGGERVLAPAKTTGLGHPYRPSVEGIIAQKPDLVITPLENIKEPPLAQLRSAKVPVLVLEDSDTDGVDGLKRRITMIAAALAVPEKGKALNDSIDARLKPIAETNAKLAKKKRVFFLYAHGPGSAVIHGRDTGAHWLIELAGGANAADFTEGTKPLTPEALVAAAPDDIIMLERGLSAVGGMNGALALTGVSLTPAGKNRAIHTVDDNIRWIGPRFLGEVEKLHADLYGKPAK